MQPIVLTNAFLRPRATRYASHVSLSESTNVYACVEEIVAAIRNNIGASPLLLPTAFDEESVTDLLRHVGAVSNVHPSRYGAEVNDRPQAFDPQHDETDFFLIRQAQKLGTPFFGICRSMQAMNVAFGGSLHQQLEENGKTNHSCSIPCNGIDDAPEYMHEALIEQGGVLASLFPIGKVEVNSMHKQAVDRLGSGLKVEARASDGGVQAISLPEAQTFFLAVQRHPETLPHHPVSQKLFGSFRASVEQRFKARRQS